MPRYDFKCPVCERLYPDLHVSLSRVHRGDYRDLVCENCGGELMKLPSAPSFTIKGYSAKNGYGSSR